MIEALGMLMVGSGGRNIGKTELACSLIRKYSVCCDVIGIKVTTIEERGGSCPRGGKGCGVCSSLAEDYCVTEETCGPPDKDTVRMLAAGAARVFWLRVLKECLTDGMNALLDRAGRDAVTVCESNSLRLAVRPGVFLMVKDGESDQYKPSAEEVKDLADRTIVFREGSLNIDMDDIDLVEGKWVLKEKATAIIMAGGKSIRMGQDKSLLPIDGRPMIEHIYDQLRPHFRQILVSAADAGDYDFLDATVVPDEVPDQGPLMGIVSALAVSENDLNLVVACDIPCIDISFLRRMLAEAEGYDCVVPVGARSRYEPLFAVYRRSILGTIRTVLSSGKRRVSDIFDVCRVKYIELGDASWLRNLNTMKEYEEYRDTV